eukprot:5153990-Prymnesium_polylepis.1
MELAEVIVNTAVAGSKKPLKKAASALPTTPKAAQPRVPEVSQDLLQQDETPTAQGAFILFRMLLLPLILAGGAVIVFASLPLASPTEGLGANWLYMLVYFLLLPAVYTFSLLAVMFVIFSPLTPLAVQAASAFCSGLFCLGIYLLLAA